MNGNNLKKELGDYQTPDFFAHRVCHYLRKELRINPAYIFEPTAGIGNFIEASLDTFENIIQAYGVEINPEYCKICKKRFNKNKVSVICDNFFACDSFEFVKDKFPMLIIGNPPWAMNSDLEYNIPAKSNLKKYSGLDAITGASNFDICEYIILKLIKEFSNTDTTIAMLCKTSVARNVLIELNKNNVLTEYVKMLSFNSGKIFGISAASCLFVIKLSANGKKTSVCEVADIDDVNKISETIEIKNGVLSIARDDILDLDGRCQLEWRQGVKHDCARIMELTQIDEGRYLNKLKEEIELEKKLVFPLIKSSAIKTCVINNNFPKYVIVTQKKAREDTGFIKKEAPKTWKYLWKNKELFEKRKSSIYNGAPAFSMFGVGPYSYAPYKVGVSGFYKKPLFTLIYNNEEIQHPVMMDDTSYFLSFDEYDIAYGCMLLLNTEKVQNFLYSISFQDAKRPYTKKVLQRLDLNKCITYITLQDLQKVESDMKLKKYISGDRYKKLTAYINQI